MHGLIIGISQTEITATTNHVSVQTVRSTVETSMVDDATQFFQIPGEKWVILNVKVSQALQRCYFCWNFSR
jgi:hypothetical protein